MGQRPVNPFYGTPEDTANPLEPDQMLYKVGVNVMTDRDTLRGTKRGAGRPTEFKDGEYIDRFKVPKDWYAIIRQLMFHGLVPHSKVVDFVRRAILNELFRIVGAVKHRSLQLDMLRLWEADQEWNDFQRSRKVDETAQLMRTAARSHVAIGRFDKAKSALRRMRRVLDTVDDPSLVQVVHNYMLGAATLGAPAPEMLDRAGELWLQVQTEDNSREDDEVYDQLQQLDLEPLTDLED